MRCLDCNCQETVRCPLTGAEKLRRADIIQWTLKSTNVELLRVLMMHMSMSGTVYAAPEIYNRF